MSLDITGIGSIADFASTIVNKIFPDAGEKEKNAAAFAVMQATQEFQLAQGQLEVNKVEASNPSIFVSGWRPFIGWTCGAACAWNWIGISIANTICAVFHYTINLAPASLEEMLPVMLGMLGLGGLRTFEKVKGTK